MNDAELDALAKRAAAGTRAEAQTIADSRAALQQVLATATADAPPPLAPVVPYHGPIRDPERRRRWQLVLVAAVIGVFALGIGYAIVNGSSTIEIAGDPISGTGTDPALATAPVTQATDPGGTSGQAPETRDAAPSTSAATTATGATMPTALGTAPATTQGAPARSGDPMDGWAAPAVRPRVLGDLPYVLARQPQWDGETVLRSESESGETQAQYTQVWVRTVQDSTTVDAVIRTTTSLSSQDLFGAGDSIDVAGWPTAIRGVTAPGTVSIEVSSPLGSVSIWSAGLELDEVTAFASSLRVNTPEDAGWTSDWFADEPWNEIEPGRWSVGFASRYVRLLGPDGLTTTEVQTVSGLGIGDLVPLFTTNLGITLVDDRVALTVEDGSRSAVVWVRSDGTTIAVGSIAPLVDTVELARALDDVGRAAWEAATSPDAEFGDGCISLFC